jgi:threonine synthase
VVIGVLKKLAASGAIKKSDLTVAVITASGLKTQEAVADVVRPFVIQPTLESFEEVLGEQARA